jgi:type I restriction enzyme M protein
LFFEKSRENSFVNKQQLASKIWESANKMRSKIEASEYKDYILGFMFYKFLSDKELKLLIDKKFTQSEIKNLNEKDTETITYIQNEIGYFISYDDLFSTWIEKGNDFDVSDVRDALNAFDRLISSTHKKLFDRVFNTLSTGLSKLGGTTGEQTKSIRELIHLLDLIPMSEKQDYDVLGFIYEYLISNFAVNAGKKAGEFYTPHEVSLLMSEIVANHLSNKQEIKIYDPTSGSGSLLINIGHSISKYMNKTNNIKYYAQELKENTYNLTRMNLIMRGILPDNIVVRNADTLENDWPYFDESDPTGTYDPLYVDAVVSNPPYSQNWDRENKESDPRYSDFGLAPKSKADYAFLLHDLYHVKPDGIMTIVLPHGVLFRGGEEGQIRKNLIEKNHIDAVIGLPANIFFGTGIPTIVMVLKQHRTTNDVLIVDASKGFVKVGNKNKLKASDVKKIVDTVIQRNTLDKFSRLVSLEELRENDYNLNIPRYVDSSPQSEQWDLYSIMFGGIPKSELDSMEKYWSEFPLLKQELFTKLNPSYLEPKNNEIKQSILDDSDVQGYLTKYTDGFSDFNLFLKRRLLDQLMSLTISTEIDELTNELFSRLLKYPLIDKYKAYEALNESWTIISIDLEMIQTEGFNTIKTTEPNMVEKKKNGKDVIVQEGWNGRILPFELAQKEFFPEETTDILLKEQRILDIDTDIQQLIDELSEEDRDLLLNDNNDAFNKKAVKQFLKSLEEDSQDPESVRMVLTQFLTLDEEQKKLKKDIKQKITELHNATKLKIENLTDDEALLLLDKKWIEPLCDSILALPNEVINSFVSSLQTIIKKYDTTLIQVDTQLRQTSDELLPLLDELEGESFDLLGIEELKSLIKGDK